MKYFLIYFLFFLSHSCIYAQEEAIIEYFPVEQLRHPDCANSDTPNDCLNGIIFNKVNSELEKINPYKKTFRDTLKINVRFKVDINGNIVGENTMISVNDSKIRKRISNKITTLINEIPTLAITNRNTELYPTFHNFYFHYLKNNNNVFEIVDAPLNLVYNGGEIIQIPLFKGSVHVDDETDKFIFQHKINLHIKKEFKYPPLALQKGIKGKVNITCKIDKTGGIIDLTAKGPHFLLEEEAKRIISLLDKFEPGLINGEPRVFPYSIPITFKF